MTLDDRQLAAQWRARAGAEVLTPECPDSESIWRAVTLESQAEERLRVIEHIASCAHCAETWRLAAAFHDPARQSVSNLRPLRRVWPQVSLIAAAVIAAAAIWLVVRDQPQTTPVLRTTAVEIRSAVGDATSLPRDRFLLRWTPGPRGTIYDIEVATTDLKLLSRQMALTTTEYLVPSQVLAGVAANETVAWRVHATLPDGRAVSTVTYFTTVH